MTDDRGAGGREPVRGRGAAAETLARRRMRALLSNVPDIILLGECETGAQAVTAIRQLEPDLGHDAWTKVYADSATYDWFLQHRTAQ